MIAGVSYHQARKKVCREEADGTSTKEVCDALAKFGIACAGRLTRLRPGDYRKLEQDAILRTRTSKSDGDSHWIVWDAKRKRIIDPEPDKADRYVRPPITSFLGVKRK
jgi:hypothetical protein